MERRGDPLTTHPIRLGWKFTIELYPNCQFGFIQTPDCQFRIGSIWTTRSDGPEPLVTLFVFPSFS